MRSKIGLFALIIMPLLSLSACSFSASNIAQSKVPYPESPPESLAEISNVAGDTALTCILGKGESCEAKNPWTIFRISFHGEPKVEIIELYELPMEGYQVALYGKTYDQIKGGFTAHPEYMGKRAFELLLPPALMPYEAILVEK